MTRVPDKYDATQDSAIGDITTELTNVAHLDGDAPAAPITLGTTNTQDVSLIRNGVVGYEQNSLSTTVQGTKLILNTTAGTGNQQSLLFQHEGTTVMDLDTSAGGVFTATIPDADYEMNMVSDSIATKKYVDDLEVGDIKNGGNSTGAPLVVGTNDPQVLNLETNNVNRLQISAAAVAESNPFGASLSCPNAYNYNASGTSNGHTLFHTAGSGLGIPPGDLIIQAGTGNQAQSGSLKLRSGRGVGGGGGAGAVFIETNTPASALSKIEIKTADMTLIGPATYTTPSGEILLKTGKAGSTSGAISLITGSALQADVGASSGNVVITTGDTTAAGASGAVGSINLTCGVAYSGAGIARNGGSITLQASRGVEGGSFGVVNLYTAPNTGMRLATADDERLLIHDISKMPSSGMATINWQNFSGYLPVSVTETPNARDGLMHNGTQWAAMRMKMAVGEIVAGGADPAVTFPLTLTDQDTWYEVAYTGATLNSNDARFMSANWDSPSLGQLRWIDMVFTPTCHTAFSASLSVSAANQSYQLALFKNGVLINGTIISKDFAASEKVDAVAFHKVVDFNLNDYISMYIRCTSTAGTIATFTNLNLVSITDLMW